MVDDSTGHEFVDYSRGQPNDARSPSTPKAGGFPPFGKHGVCLYRL